MKRRIYLAFGAGVVAGLSVVALGVLATVALGLVPVATGGGAGAIETWAADTARSARIRREAPVGPNPISAGEPELLAAADLYKVNCAVCHGEPAAHGRFARGMFPDPPQLLEQSVADDPAGQVFWVIKHGIRLSGMPAFEHALGDAQIWQLVALVQAMDKLPPTVSARL